MFCCHVFSKRECKMKLLETETVRETVGKERHGAPIIFWVDMTLQENCSLDQLAASGTLFGRHFSLSLLPRLFHPIT